MAAFHSCIDFCMRAPARMAPALRLRFSSFLGFPIMFPLLQLETSGARGLLSDFSTSPRHRHYSGSIENGSWLAVTAAVLLGLVVSNNSASLVRAFPAPGIHMFCKRKRDP
jgi:hypothetical protein